MGVLTYRKEAKEYPADHLGRHDHNLFSFLLTETGTKILPTDVKAAIGRFSDGWAVINYEPMTVKRQKLDISTKREKLY